MMNNMDSLLSVTAIDKYAKVHSSLWVTFNKEMCLPEREINSYDPYLISESFGEAGTLRSSNYFLYYRKLKRIVLFTYQGLSPFSTHMGKCGSAFPDYVDDEDLE